MEVPDRYVIIAVRNHALHVGKCFSANLGRTTLLSYSREPKRTDTATRARASRRMAASRKNVVGSHFLTLHIGSPAGILELMEGEPLATLNQIPNRETRRFAERIKKGDYARDPETLEHPEGDMFVRAFRALSALSSKSRITLEIYDDDERTPELWNFIWSAWEPVEAFALPLSPFGAPHVTYKDRGAIAKYLDQFKQVRESGGYDTSFVSSRDLDSLISVLETVAADGPGVFVFIEY